MDLPATVGPRLTERLEASEPDATLDVLVEVEGEPDLPDGAGREERVDALRVAAAERRRPVEDALGDAGAESVGGFWVATAVAATATPAAVRAVADRGDVRAVSLAAPRPVGCFEPDGPADGYDGPTRREYDGGGTVVAVLGSGVDDSHPALAGRVTGRVGDAGDGPGTQGTHCAAVVAAAAPGTDVLDVPVLDAEGRGRSAAALRGLQDALVRGADVVLLGAGWSHPGHGWRCPDGHCALCAGADRAVELGAVVVVPVGDDGTDVPPGVDTGVRCPGNARGVVAVGATGDDGPAPLSSRGPGSYDCGKPDVCAPGVEVPAAAPGTGAVRASGTAVAAARVAGVAARLLGIHPHLGCIDVRHVLATTADRCGPRAACGNGLVAPGAAVEYLVGAPDGPEVYVRDNHHDLGTEASGGGAHSPDVWVQLVRTGREARGLVEPHTDPEVGQPNYVFTRVHNRGSETAERVAVHLWAHRFSTDPRGGDSNTVVVEDLAPCETRVVGPFEWEPPRTGHGCLRVAVDYPGAPFDGWGDRNRDNGLAQRNIDVRDLQPPASCETVFDLVGRDEPCEADLVVDCSAFPGDVEVRLYSGLLRDASEDGLAVVEETDRKTTLSVVDPVGRAEGMALEADELTPVYLTARLPGDVERRREFPVRVEQRVDGETVGDVTLNCFSSEPTPYVRNDRTGEVHRHDCTWAERIHPDNRVPVRSLARERQRGFPSMRGPEGCKYCLPRFHLR